jgi:DNA-directed RNA polymerase subunit RPC12/RpoP
MVRGRRSLDLTDYRSVMRSSGDVSIGAYARQQRQRRLLVGVAGLIFILGAVWLYSVLQPAEEVDREGRYPLAVRCMKCGYEGVVLLEVGAESFPLPCPECGERACHKLWLCRACGKTFLRKGGEDVVRCPACGSAQVGEAAALRDPEAGPGDGPQGVRGNGR